MKRPFEFILTILFTTPLRLAFIQGERVTYAGHIIRNIKPSFKFKPPEIEILFIHLNIGNTSIKAQISPEFSNLYYQLGGILMHYAVEDKNYNLLENLIDRKAALNIENREGVTPVYKAMEIENEDMVEMLYDAGAQVNYVSSIGRSLLSTSIMKGHQRLFEKLLNFGVNIDKVTSDKKTPLYQVLEKGNENMTEILLKRKVNMNTFNSEGETLLSQAVTEGRLDVMKQLLRYGADVNKANIDGTRPLYKSLQVDNPGLTRILIENGAHSNSTAEDGNTLAHIAVLQNASEVITKLITLKANFSALNNDFLTPLCYAIKLNRSKAVKVMIQGKIDLNKPCNGLTEYPLHFAIVNGSTESVELLLEGGAKTTILNAQGYSPLVLAIFNNRDNCIELLKKEFVDVNYRLDKENDAPLHRAVAQNNQQAIRKLIELGANVNILNKDGFSPLSKATQINNTEIIALLFKNNAQINQQNAYGETALHIGVKSEAISAIIQLTKLGADTNRTDSKGFTPLCLAIYFNLERVINSLIFMKANVKAECNGQSTIELAVSFSTLTTLKRLQNLGVAMRENYTSQCERAVKADNLEIFKYLISMNNLKNDWGKELLFLAALSDSYKVAREILKIGITVDVESKNGLTPLWVATKNNKNKVMEVFLEYGARVNHTVEYTRDGLAFRNWTLLHEAAFSGFSAATEVLLRNGMDTELRDGRGWTGLHYAAAQHHSAVVRLLLGSGASVQARTNTGETPLDLLKHRRSYLPQMAHWLTTGQVQSNGNPTQQI